MLYNISIYGVKGDLLSLINFNNNILGSRKIIFSEITQRKYLEDYVLIP